MATLRDNPLATPPQNLEAEQSVLGACLIDRKALETAALLVRPKHFYLEAHRDIFQAMLDVAESGPVDMVTLADALRTRGLLERVGGASYLAGLADIVPTTANVEYYAGIVHDKALRRDTLEASHDLERWAYDEGIQTPDMLATVERRVLSIAELRGADVPGMTEGLEETREYLNAGRGVRIPLYLDTLTHYMNGGMLPRYYTLVGADPGIGKTRLVIKDIYHQIQAGRSVVFFSLEQPRPEILSELLALSLGINRDGLGCEGDREFDPLVTTPSDADYQRAEACMREWPLRVYDGAIDAEDMEPILRRVQRKGPVDLVYVDYAGIVSVHGATGAERMEQVSAYLSQMFKRCKVAGIVLCHVTRDNGEIKPWYSRKLEQDCQSFWYVPKPDEATLSESNPVYKFQNIKNRYARRSRHTLYVGWDNNFGHFVDLPKGQRGAGM